MSGAAGTRAQRKSLLGVDEGLITVSALARAESAGETYIVTSDIIAGTKSFANALRDQILAYTPAEFSDQLTAGLPGTAYTYSYAPSPLVLTVSSFTASIADDTALSDCNKALIAASWPPASYLARSWGADVATTCPLPPPSVPLPVPSPPQPPAGPPELPMPRPPPPPPPQVQASQITFNMFAGMGSALVGALLIGVMFLCCCPDRSKPAARSRAASRAPQRVRV